MNLKETNKINLFTSKAIRIKNGIKNGLFKDKKHPIVEINRDEKMEDGSHPSNITGSSPIKLKGKR